MFSGQQALITGGTTGIGRAIAGALRNAGCGVTVTGISDEEVELFTASHPHQGLKAVPLDVTNESRIAQVVGQFTRLDILVNCAGIILRNGAEHDPVQFARVLDVNLTGTMRMCVACRSRLAEHGGCVVNLASMLSFFGSGFVPAYSASKGGIAQLTKSLAIAWAEQNIRVNAIAPGWIATALTQPLIDNPERRDGIIERTPLRRWGRPEDVAGAAVFLCSPAAAFITGVVLPVDGGYSIA